jgi:hypothetical protein
MAGTSKVIFGKKNTTEALCRKATIIWTETNDAKFIVTV